ncbi:hypothetical protein N8Z26_02580 [Burkholderiales bacterium]|nr:hypothetical protein [Burkholderiales bacterium]
MSWIKKFINIKKMRSITLSLVLVLSSILIPLFAGSSLVISIIGYQNVTSQDIVLAWDRNNHRKMLNSVEGFCSEYSNTLQLHPYFAATHNKCMQLNELQLLGNRLDWENQNIHRVGIFGGSVASQFASYNVPGYFQELLNQCINVKDKNVEFSVLNFSDGSWKHPSQSIGLILYGDYLDTALSIEGFNEHYMIGSNIDLAQPSSNFEVAARNLKLQVKLRLLDEMFEFFKGTIFENLSVTKLSLLTVRSFLINSISVSQGGADEHILLQNMATYKPANVENIDRYQSFVRTFLNIAGDKGIPALVFLQPAPIYKPLTNVEKTLVRNMNYEKQYEQLRGSTLISPKFIDLSDLFSDTSETIFGDDIHFLRGPDDDFGRTLGDRMLSKVIVAEMLKGYPEIFTIKDSCLGLFPVAD